MKTADNDAVVIGGGETALMIAADAILAERQCDDLRVLMASTDEGGEGARTEEVPARENQCQGGSYVRQFPPDGERFLVLISSPTLVGARWRG